MFTVHEEDGRWAVKLEAFNLCCNDVGEADRLAADLNAAIAPMLTQMDSVHGDLDDSLKEAEEELAEANSRIAALEEAYADAVSGLRQVHQTGSLYGVGFDRVFNRAASLLKEKH